jgi:hypothetical protein
MTTTTVAMTKIGDWWEATLPGEHAYGDLQLTVPGQVEIYANGNLLEYYHPSISETTDSVMDSRYIGGLLWKRYFHTAHDMRIRIRPPAGWRPDDGIMPTLTVGVQDYVPTACAEIEVLYTTSEQVRSDQPTARIRCYGLRYRSSNVTITAYDESGPVRIARCEYPGERAVRCKENVFMIQFAERVRDFRRAYRVPEILLEFDTSVSAATNLTVHVSNVWHVDIDADAHVLG